MKYIAYARKSTEDPERQILSTPAQINKIKEQFPDIEIVRFFEEHKTAFTEDVREGFYTMIEMIDRGEAEGIVAWHPNRLSRNEIDAARITSKLRKGVIKDVKFCSYTFENTPEGIWMLQMTLSQGQYESAKLSRDVKRGNDQKLSIGGPTGLVPQGYINNLATKMADVDEERFDLVRKMWDMLLSGHFTVPQIHRIVDREWNYRTVRRKRTGGGPLALSALYGIFSNLFYAGVILHKGIQYKGKHKPMITLEEYDRAQTILGRKGKPRSKTHKFAYTGLIECGECGCSITAQRKSKYIKTTGELKTYTYYHCTRKKKDINCTQNKTIDEKELEKQMLDLVGKYTILPEFRDWALEVINRQNLTEADEREKILKMKRSSLLSLEKEQDGLIDLATRKLITDDVFVQKARKLETDIETVRESIKQMELNADAWRETAVKSINYASQAVDRFKNGSEETRRKIMLELGTKMKLQDKILEITPNVFMEPIQNSYVVLEKEYNKVRTGKNAPLKAKNAAIAAVISEWQGLIKDVITAQSMN